MGCSAIFSLERSESVPHTPCASPLSVWIRRLLGYELFQIQIVELSWCCSIEMCVCVCVCGINPRSILFVKVDGAVAANLGDTVEDTADKVTKKETPAQARAKTDAMSRDALEDTARVDRALSTMSLKKVAVPEDIAAQILFFASDRLAGHLSGQVVTVAGGMEGRQIP